jgi:hypothetical protein
MRVVMRFFASRLFLPAALKLGLFAVFVAVAASSAGCYVHGRGYVRYAHRYHHHRHWHDDDGYRHYGYPP